MKIVHLCLSCFYIDNFSYQENELVAQNVRDGHDVLVIASTETYGSDKKITYLNPGRYIGSDGAEVVRIPYRTFLPQPLMRKLRMHPGVYSLLEENKPDVIYFHGLCGWELLTAAKYKKKHPGARFYIDSHTDFHNSATSFFAKYILHNLYYKSIAKLAQNEAEKILCVSLSTIEFARDFYEIPSDKLEFYPLGGELLSADIYEKLRMDTRASLGIQGEERVFLQSGKIDGLKKLLESLRSFSKIKNPNCKFLIVGSLQDDIQEEAEKLIAVDSRVTYLGWKSPEDLRSLLCAADVYVQPGSQSATMQMSICCNCAVILDDVASHKPYVHGNGWLVNNSAELDNAFESASSIPTHELQKISNRSEEIASELLDYRKLAARIYR